MRWFLAALCLCLALLFGPAPAQARGGADIPNSWHLGWGNYVRWAERPMPVRRYARHRKRFKRVLVHKTLPAAAVVARTTTPLPAPRPEIKLEPIAPADRKNIFEAYADGLLRPAGNCKEYESVDQRVKLIVSDAVKYFASGPALIISCYRPLAYNRQLYGNRCSRGRCRGDGSYHIKKMALDFTIKGVAKEKLYAYVRRHHLTGGVGIYRMAAIHVDVRPRARGKVVVWDWRAKHKVRLAKRRYVKRGLWAWGV